MGDRIWKTNFKNIDDKIVKIHLYVNRNVNDSKSANYPMLPYWPGSYLFINNKTICIVSGSEISYLQHLCSFAALQKNIIVDKH